MSDAEHDPVVRHAIDELRRLPAVDPEAVRRVVAAAAAARVAPAVDEPIAPARRLPRRWIAIAGAAAAAAFAGFVYRGSHAPVVETRFSSDTSAAVIVADGGAAAGRGTATVTALTGGTMLRSVSSSASEALPIAWQFVIHDSRAHRVAVVGDFNQWNSKSAPMTRSANSSLWSVTIPILPGRHMYGFIVDDSTFLLDPDPRVARARDADLGVEGSVMIAGRP